MRQISTSNGCRSFRSVDSGLRPKATEISFFAPSNFPFGEVQASSATSFTLTLRILFSPNVGGRMHRTVSPGSVDEIRIILVITAPILRPETKKVGPLAIGDTLGDIGDFRC